MAGGILNVSPPQVHRDVRHSWRQRHRNISVKTDGDEPVYELKNKIKQANPTTLASFEVSALKLYKFNIHVPDTPPYKTLTDSISRRTIEFNKRDELVNPFGKLSTVPGGFPEDNLHILVEVLAGESFSSRPRRSLTSPCNIVPCNDSLITAVSSAPKHKRSAEPPVVAEVAAKRRCVPCGRVPPSASGNAITHYDLDPILFATNVPPPFDLIPFALLHPAFAEFDDAEIMPDDQDVLLVRELQMRMTRNRNAELNKCEEFRTILAKYILQGYSVVADSRRWNSPYLRRPL